MGEVELYTSDHKLVIRGVVFFYGDAADQALAIQTADEITLSWNEPQSMVRIRKEWFQVRFDIEGIYTPDLAPATVWHNTCPRYNYFRIEEYSRHDISFVDGLGSNTGYFKRANLQTLSTTGAHEYGHTLGLDHPKVLDIRGKGQPGIMYPRGTLCDPAFQYDPDAPAGAKGGTLNPFTRKVLDSDIQALKLSKLSFDKNNIAVLGEYSSLYHQKHIEKTHSF
ncbi:MAG TPA: peptidase M10 [Puia sp.]|jgi:hypothetical protein